MSLLGLRTILAFGTGILFNVEATWKLHQKLIGKMMPALVLVR